MTTDTYDLTPTQYLVMEVLAARYRLGESHWTFPVFANKPLNALAARGWVRHKNGITEGTIRAWLTEDGLEAWALNQPYPPTLTAPETPLPHPGEPTMNLLHPEVRGIIEGLVHLLSRRKTKTNEMWDSCRCIQDESRDWWRCPQHGRSI